MTVASPAMITAWRPSIVADAGDGADAGRFAVVLVVGQQESDFEEGRAGVDQGGDAFAGGHFAGAVLALDFGGAATQAEAVFELLELVDEEAHVGDAGDFVCGGGGGFGKCAHDM